MAGHSQFSNIKYRKEAQDSKRAKKFTKLRREIIVAAKSGISDPDSNPRLRAAISTARREGLPKDKIDHAIKSSKGENKDENYEQATYEGYGPCGAAFILDSLTNNRNRTAAELRFIFSRNGGNLAETGSVSYLFNHVGVISYNKKQEEIFDFALEHNASDIEEIEDNYNIICEVKDFGKLRDLLYEKFDEPKFAGVMWQAKDLLQLNEEDKPKVIRLLDALEDNDDVQSLYHNT